MLYTTAFGLNPCRLQTAAGTLHAVYLQYYINDAVLAEAQPV